MESVFAHSTRHLKILVARTLQNENQDIPSELLSESDKIRLQNFTNKEKKLEFLTGRLCASAVTDRLLKFDCKANEPPMVEKGYLSIAHTSGFAAAAYHDHKKIGIDIECRHRTVKDNIVKRFASEEELEHIHEPEHALKLWCAKEAVFKAGHTHGLEFKTNIRIDWEDLHSGTGRILSNSVQAYYSIGCFLVENIIVVFAVER